MRNSIKYNKLTQWILGCFILIALPAKAQDNIESQEIIIVKDFNVFIERLF